MDRTSFFRMVLRKFSEITENKPIFSQYNIFTIMNISFFNLRFDPFSIIAKEVNQIKNNVICVIARLVFVYCCVLTTGRCKLKEIKFYGPYFQTMIFLVTMV